MGGATLLPWLANWIDRLADRLAFCRTGPSLFRGGHYWETLSWDRIGATSQRVPGCREGVKIVCENENSDVGAYLGTWDMDAAQQGNSDIGAHDRNSKVTQPWEGQKNAFQSTYPCSWGK